MEHIREYHAISTTFFITCGMNGCLRRFKNFLSFRTHVYQWHGGDPNVSNNPVVLMDPPDQDPNEELVNVSHDTRNDVYVNGISSFSSNGNIKKFYPSSLYTSLGGCSFQITLLMGPS